MRPSLSVLIVDDDATAGSVVLRMLQFLGAKARLVTDPREAEAALTADKPELIVSDLSMPGLSGIDVLSSAKERFPDVRRCLVSGSLEDLNTGDLPRIEPCSVLTKPWSAASILELVRVAATEGAREYAKITTS